jgi:hypothetical protein
MAKVTVGCKLPHGLQIRVGETAVVLAGTNSSLVIGGHGITEGVDKDFFDAWMLANKDSAAVQGGFIFAHAKTDNVKAEAEEKADNRNGFEGLDPDKPAPGIEAVKED